MPVINEEEIHRQLAMPPPPSVTTSVAAEVEGAPKEFHASSSTASLNRLLTRVGNSQCAITMKQQSQSMTSLPPTSLMGGQLATITTTGKGSVLTTTTASANSNLQLQGDSGSEMIQARLRAERPYNSLKVSGIKDPTHCRTKYLISAGEN